MKIHEYQAKALLAPFGVPVPRGEVAFTPDEARAAAERQRIVSGAFCRVALPEGSYV
ncbi:MAG: hypothetical protein OXH75_12845, partial [Acidobacteria bacterium]|nr:hypothetical protein [Acidobacteriota bacterium]